MGYKTPPGNNYQQLNIRQRRFVKLYTGHSEIAGNATRCYMAAYQQENQICAQRSGSKLLKHPRVAAILAQAEERAMAQLTINAGFVLNESLRMYRRAMGDESVELVTSTVDPETGQDRVEVRTVTEYDPATAHKALQSIGSHKDVQAYSVTVEHNHTHHLEQRLAARSKLIEGKAQVLVDDGEAQQLQHVSATDPAQGEHIIDGGEADTGRHTPPPDVDVESKRVHTAEVNEDRNPAEEKTSCERAGQRAE